MPERRVLAIAADSYLHGGYGPVPYAEAGAKALAAALGAKPTLLPGHFSTKAIVESRLRKLKQSAKAGDTLVVIVCGHGIQSEGANRLLCWDSMPDDLPGTTLSLTSLVKELTASKAAGVVLLLDVEGKQGPWNPEELEQLAEGSAKLVILSSCEPGESSHTLPARGCSAWTAAVLEAFAGRAPKAADRHGKLTAGTLQKWLGNELPRMLRSQPGRAVQTPRLDGDATAKLLDLSPLLKRSAGMLDAERLKRLVFRGEIAGRVRDLAGFRKTFRIPETSGAAVQKFIARCAEPDLRADLDGIFERSREEFGYRRKDLATAFDAEGRGTMRTPDFEYAVGVRLDPADTTRTIWRRELGQLTDPGFLRTPGFVAAFGETFDLLAFEFARPFDVAGFVDRLEETPLPGAKLNVMNDGAACEMTLKGFAGRIRIEANELNAKGKLGDPAGLLDQLLGFFTKYGGLMETKALA